MSIASSRFFLGWVGSLLWATGLLASDLEFFEKQVRPLLADRCYECHGSKKQQGGLRLDTAAGRTRGGDSGPAWVAGNPAASRLVQAVRWGDPDLQMPPKKPLPDEEVRILEEWVQRGAPAPEFDLDPWETVSPLSRTQHWAYQPVQAAPIPVVQDPTWPRNPLDSFTLARLEAEGMTPAPDAPAGALARRLFFDLIGLPPSPDQLAAFQAAVERDRTAAITALVDDLLASPQFGERWARHWFDVVRFAESVTLRGFIFPEAWRYRDYVIDAFNRDLPFDQFVREQIAGDLLGGDSVEERQRRLAATTFLALGNTNLEEQDKRQLEMDVIDEQLDVLGKAFLGQAFSCARCHDHKFDPVPTRDYYALAGILASTRLLEHANVSRWVERPLPLPETEEAAMRAHEEQVAALAAEIEAVKAELKQITDTAPAKAVPVVAAHELPGTVVDDSAAIAVGEWRPSTHTRPFIDQGYLHDDASGKGAKTLTFHPDLAETGLYEVRLAYPSGENRARAVPVTIFSADGEVTVTVNQQERPPVEGRFVSLGRHHFEAQGAGFVLVSNEGTTGHVVADAVQFLRVDLAAATDSSVSPEDSPSPADSTGPSRIAELERRLPELEEARKQKLATGPRRPRVMAPTEAEPVNLPIHHRGSVHHRGEVVPRGVWSLAFSAPVGAMPSDASGRRELADWLTAPENPLTARVFVNRVWHWLFGAGLVRSVDNFGTTGEAPSHPELLDYLATRFTEQGWSVKGLIRPLVQSRTYQQAVAPATETDPLNRWLGHSSRRRLEAECLRDAMLALSGELDLSPPAGPTFDPQRTADYGFHSADRRRSLYLPVFRNALPEMLTVFDFADPSRVVGMRDQSTVAPQALFLMNHAFVRECAQAAARRWMETPQRQKADRLKDVGQATLGRPLTPGEESLLRTSLQQANDALDGWTEVFHALFCSLDFRYLE